MATVPVNSLLDEVIDFLVSSPTLEQIVNFHASDVIQAHVSELLDRKRNAMITAAEMDEMEEISCLNHFVTILKARAHIALIQKHSR
ncbi:MAG: hypothetical protein ACYDBJ_07740 [Aggregatilineales bacterium]